MSEGRGRLGQRNPAPRPRNGAAAVSDDASYGGRFLETANRFSGGFPERFGDFPGEGQDPPGSVNLVVGGVSQEKPPDLLLYQHVISPA